MKNIFRYTALLMIMFSVLLITGCNGGSGKVAQAPCEMLTQDDLSSLFSGPAEGRDISETIITETVHDSNLQKSSGCQYALTGKLAEKSEENPFPTPENIHIEYIVAANPEKAEAAYDKAVELWETSTIPNRTYKKIDDVGTKAFWSYSFNVSQFIVYSDTKVFFITLGYFQASEDEILNKAKTVARKVIERVS